MSAAFALVEAGLTAGVSFVMSALFETSVLGFRGRLGAQGRAKRRDDYRQRNKTNDRLHAADANRRVVKSGSDFL